MCEENSFRVTGTAGAGLGILSTRRILRGEIILQEKPLLLVESKIKENEYSWFDLKPNANDGYCILNTYIREEKIAYLRTKVSSLKKKDREQFYSLFDCKQEEGKILPTISNSPLGSSGHKKSASGIFRTNNFALGALDSSPDHGVNIWEKNNVQVQIKPMCPS